MLGAASVPAPRPTTSDFPLSLIRVLVPALLVDPAASKTLYTPILLLTRLGKLHVLLLFLTSTLSPLVSSARGCFPRVVLGDAGKYEAGNMDCLVSTSAMLQQIHKEETNTPQVVFEPASHKEQWPGPRMSLTRGCVCGRVAAPLDPG